ncbi:MAG: hypothetical protein JWM53_982 [bacterium]|nr:hypothetical protein [bacterium]
MKSIVVSGVVVAVAALAAAGCKSTPENGFAVDVTVAADASLADAQLSQVRTLDVSVSGAEIFHTNYAIGTQLASRAAKFIYRPSASAGTLTFAVYALDDSGGALAFGQGMATLKSGATTTLTVTLGTANVPSTDMAMCPTACPTLGATQCMGTQVQTCQMIDGCQTWGPATDCGADMLCCANACVAADVSNCYACGTSCGGSTPACLPTPMSCGCNIAVCAAGNMGCDTATGNCVACAALAANSADFYVDATSFAGGTGNATCPFKTITAALTAANASTAATKIIHIAAGTYAAGETFPLVVRKGISLAGAGASTTTIKGTGVVDHSTLGGTFNGAAYIVTILTGDATGTSTFSGLTITDALTAPAAGYLGVFCDQGNAASTLTTPPPATLPTPTTVLSGVTVGPNYDYAVAAATTTTPLLAGCNIKIVGSTITGNNNGMWAVGCGNGVGKISVAAALGDGTAAGGNTFINNKNGSGGGVGVLAWDCVSPLTFDNNVFDGGDSAVAVTNHSGTAGGDASLTQPNLYEVRNNTFKNLTVGGFDADRGAVIDQLTGNTFTNISSGASGTANAIAMRFSTSNSQVIKARNNTFIGNDVGVQAEVNAFVAGTRPAFDWGSAADPGNNTFACNSSGHAGGTGADFVFSVAAGSTVTIPLRSNKWDHVPPMTSATAANGLDLLNIGAVPVDTTGAALAGITCPTGHIP